MKYKRTLVSFIVSFLPLLISCGFSFDPSGGGSSKEDILELNVVAFNDFHGAIEEDSNNGRMGLAKLGTYLKQQSEEDNTLILSQGDDWQGSIYSNYNRGRLVNDVYSYCHLSARTVGNHDFDWGVEALEANTAAGYDDYVTPVLAANVYDYDFSTKTNGNTQQIEIGQQTITYTLENGLKVGIVGVIGKDQITSITSSYTEDICFKDHIDIVKTLATQLREENDCDVVIASAHTGQEDLIGNNLSDYVDLVLCGHTHKSESTTEGNLHYEQFGAYGRYVGNITLTYNTKTHKVNYASKEVIDDYSINSKITSIDTTIQSLINQYNVQCDAEANEVLASNVTGTFKSSYEAPNLMCKAIYDQCVAEGHSDVVLTYCNQARSNLYSDQWDYSNIYQSFPFDNVIYIESVKGWDIINEVAKYNNVYINPSFDCIINPNSYYKIAVIDYLLYHTNSNRSYDYFYYFDGQPDDQLSINYRLILRKWLKDNDYNTGTLMSSSDYSSYMECFDRSRITQA